MYSNNIEQFILGLGTSSIPAMLTLSLPLNRRAGNVCLNSFIQNERPGGRRLYSFLNYRNARATELQGYGNRTALIYPCVSSLVCHCLTSPETSHRRFRY